MPAAACALPAPECHAPAIPKHAPGHAAHWRNGPLTKVYSSSKSTLGKHDQHNHTTVLLLQASSSRKHGRRARKLQTCQSSFRHTRSCPYLAALPLMYTTETPIGPAQAAPPVKQRSKRKAPRRQHTINRWVRGSSASDFTTSTWSVFYRARLIAMAAPHAARNAESVARQQPLERQPKSATHAAIPPLRSRRKRTRGVCVRMCQEGGA
ncbi:hypothetical protein JKP88DRAFT_226120, partial [Tribonema minus]